MGILCERYIQRKEQANNLQETIIGELNEIRELLTEGQVRTGNPDVVSLLLSLQILKMMRAKNVGRGRKKQAG